MSERPKVNSEENEGSIENNQFAMDWDMEDAPDKYIERVEPGPLEMGIDDHGIREAVREAGRRREERLRAFGDENVIIFSHLAAEGFRPEDDPDQTKGKLYGEFLNSLNDEEWGLIRALRANKEDYKRVENNISRSAPFLLEGRLSPKQEEILGDTHYAIGINQTGINTVQEANQYLDENHGIDLGIYNLDQRFILFNRESERNENIEPWVVNGYYRQASLGKFVIAIPIDSAEPDIAMSSCYIDDFYQDNGERSSVSPRYVAGLIDKDGYYHENANFGTSNEPLFAEEQQEASTQA